MDLTTDPSGLRQLTALEFEAALAAYDLEVDRTGRLGTDASPEIDIACSSSDWLMPSLLVWAADSDPWILQSPEGFVVLTRTTDADGNIVLVPPDSMWGFASPIISARPQALISQLATALLEDPSWDLIVLTGLAPDQYLESVVRRGLHEHFALYSGPGMTRCRIEIPSFAEREGSKRRRERRRIINKCTELGVQLVDPLDDSDASIGEIFDRILGVEAQSWKGLEGSGIIEPNLQRFYRTMVERIPRERLRVYFAHLAGDDIGYILGHTRGTEYRGLQISYAASHRHLSIGSFLQTAEIERAMATGIRSYDLGMDMPYKQRWATHTFTTRTTAIARDTELLGDGATDSSGSSPASETSG